TLDEHRTWLGEIMAPFTKVAASRPDLAWFPEIRTPDELSTVSDDNRMIAEPYPKNLNAIMQVDMGGALILLSAQAAEAAGVPRGLTVTGGLPFFGGPGNNYVSHAIATMAQLLRAEPDAIGLTSGVSYYMSKHAVGIYSSSPPPNRWQFADTSDAQKRIDAG